MPAAPNSHVGVIRTITVSGFGLMDSMNGEYDLDLATPGRRVYRRRDAAHFFAAVDPKPYVTEAGDRWVLQSAAGHALQHAEAGTPTPAGRYACPNGGRPSATCQATPEPRSLVSLLAFPAPTQYLFGFYQYNLLRRPDLVMLRAGSKGERVPAVYLKTPGAALTVLYSHGNAEDLGLIVDHLAELGRQVNAHVFAYDYVGYSTSAFEGFAPSEHGCLRAAAAAWEHLTDDLGVSPAAIVLYGRSIGSGPTVDLAHRVGCRDSVAGVVLECGILSGGSVLLGPSAGRLLAWPADIFTNYAKLPRVNRPVAVLHGTADTVVPLVNGERLHALAPHPFPPLWVEGYGHNDMPARVCADYTAQFLRHLEADLPERAARVAKQRAGFAAAVAART